MIEAKVASSTGTGWMLFLTTGKSITDKAITVNAFTAVGHSGRTEYGQHEKNDAQAKQN